MKVFVDTNVLLDVLARREPFYADSAGVWTLTEAGRVNGFVSAVSLPTLFYLLSRSRGRREARGAMALLRDIFTLVPTDAQIISRAIDCDIEDFEDAIQFFSALRAGAATLITRNPKDFPTTDVSIQTPTQFLATHFQR
ncbi:MAG: PIN domain-containing protein [Phycisphaerae bacterium]|nr:PIN domain-containing protein [Phycisphaerae bacterium]